jgi:hypothetical protein
MNTKPSTRFFVEKPHRYINGCNYGVHWDTVAWSPSPEATVTTFIRKRCAHASRILRVRGRVYEVSNELMFCSALSCCPAHSCCPALLCPFLLLCLSCSALPSPAALLCPALPFPAALPCSALLCSALPSPAALLCPLLLPCPALQKYIGHCGLDRLLEA